MFDRILEVQSLSLVFIGEFNPVIISPFWLAHKGLIREEEAENAEINVIHNDVVEYNLGWVHIAINRKRCEFNTSKSPYFDAVRDLATSVFKILKETPIYSIGINHIFDLRLPDEKVYYNFGAQLTNLDIWSDGLDDPRIMNLEVIEMKRKDGLKGRYRIRISPTDKKIQYGISININDHFELEKESSDASGLLISQWENSFKRAGSVSVQFIEKLNL